MPKVFCKCDKCQRDIMVGEIMITLSQDRNRIEDESCVRPLAVNVVGTWCESCADELTKH